MLGLETQRPRFRSKGLAEASHCAGRPQRNRMTDTLQSETQSATDLGSATSPFARSSPAPGTYRPAFHWEFMPELDGRGHRERGLS